MKWEATTDGETIEITDESGRIVADYVPEDAAPLIAAAPDLLDALKEIVNAWDPMNTRVMQRDIQAAERAIRKAEATND